MFCQREAAETAIFLAEVAGRHGTADFRRRIEPENARHNDGLPRVALKMATGTGKTVVMAMLIAWQTINKVATPNDARFAKRFLVVTPGHHDPRPAAGACSPSDDDNYYRERDLVPPDLWDALLQAQIVITNYHAFLPRDAKEIQGVARNTRKLLPAGKTVDPFRETPDDGRRGSCARLRRLAARARSSCSTTRPTTATRTSRSSDAATSTPRQGGAEERNAEARVWFNGPAGDRRRRSASRRSTTCRRRRTT